jgi:hypothetical protein
MLSTMKLSNFFKSRICPDEVEEGLSRIVALSRYQFDVRTQGESSDVN